MTSTPTWLTEACPSWCVREHCEQDHPDDRYHQSETSFVPVVTAVRDTVPITASMRGIDLTIWMGQYVGESLVWVVIEPDEVRTPRLVLSAESAISLSREVAMQVTSFCRRGR
jgi:hypothetical protein